MKEQQEVPEIHPVITNHPSLPTYFPSADAYWGCLADFATVPSAGHLPPPGTNPVSITVKRKSILCMAYPLTCRLTHIKYRNSVLVDREAKGQKEPEWDDSMKVMRWVSDGGQSQPLSVNGSLRISTDFPTEGVSASIKPKNVVEMEHKPEHDVCLPSKHLLSMESPMAGK
jgi:hypothetical protein